MGTAITLEVGGLELTYSKNDRGIDHGSLFQEHDRKRHRSEQIDYDYFRESGEEPAPMEMAFSRRLEDIVPRLELLGFSLDRVRREYEQVSARWREQMQSSEDGEPAISQGLMGFDEFCEFVADRPISSFDGTYVERFSEEVLQRNGSSLAFVDVDRIPNYLPHANHAFSERSYFAGLIDIMHPYSVLRLLGVGNSNSDEVVLWQYGPLLDAGWASEGDFYPCARRRETFLIATEGSSDVHILKHALSILRPSIADFFRFIDVADSHPFSGTGNLSKFAEGLAKIDVHNQVLFIFDNDAEGFEAFGRLLKLSLPNNMRGAMLPELDAFRSFLTEGPNGVSKSDINRRGAAIECYLDLEKAGQPPAKVEWTSLKRQLGVYQGALAFKESYVKDFLRLNRQDVAKAAYDLTKMNAVLDLLVSECTKIVEQRSMDTE